MPIDLTLYGLRAACVYFNVLLSAWLAVTIVLNARERVGPVLFAAFSLFCGAVFFAIYGVGRLYVPLRGIVPALGGPVGGFVVMVLLFLPLAWFLVVLHYAGYREIGARISPATRWRIRLAILIGCGLFFLTLIAAALTLRELLAARASNSVLYTYRMVRGLEIRGFLALFGAHLLVSTGFALAILIGPPFAQGGVRGLARSKARRAMLRAGGMLFALALGIFALVGLFFAATHGRPRPHPLFWSVLFRFDAVAAAMGTFVIYYVGRAIISYEIFSGTVLPERGLQRQWKNAVSFCVYYALFGAGLYFVSYAALLAGLVGGGIAVLFLVRLGRRLRNERALQARSLRPFLGSQDLYATVLRATGTDTKDGDRATDDGSIDDPDNPARQTFDRFCHEILEARYAALVPVGSSAALVTRPLIFRVESMPILKPDELAATCERVAADILERRSRVEPGDRGGDPALNFVATEEQAGGFIAAIPLWSKERTVGVLLLGEKSRGGVYTLEEAEIAQAAGERLIDVLTAARLAGVLRDLERARLAEMELSDDRARRVLHDEVLPEIHALMLRPAAPGAEIAEILAGLHRRVSALLHAMPGARPETGAGLVEVLGGLSAEVLGVDRFVLDIADEARAHAAALPVIQTEVLYFAIREGIRNATRHARRSGRDLEIVVRVTAPGEDTGLEITVADNGPGDESAGSPANTAGAGAGRGLALHGAMVAVIGGTLSFAREADGGRLKIVL